MSIIRTLNRSSNTEENNFTLRRSSVARQWASAPSFVGVGSITDSGTGGVVSWPTKTCKGHLGVLVVETSGADTTITVSGWTHFSGSPVVDVADATGSKLNVLWKFLESDTPATITLPDPGDHTVARVLTFRDVGSTPSLVTATGAKTTASTSLSWPTLNTVSPNSLILYIASRPDDSSSTTSFSSFANASLTGVAEATEAGGVGNNGGGFVVAYGTKAAIGSIGTATATVTPSVTNAYAVIALEADNSIPA